MWISGSGETDLDSVSLLAEIELASILGALLDNLHLVHLSRLPRDKGLSSPLLHIRDIALEVVAVSNQQVCVTAMRHAQTNEVGWLKLKIWGQMKRLQVMHLKILRTTTCSASWIGSTEVMLHRRPMRRTRDSMAQIPKFMAQQSMQVTEMGKHQKPLWE